MVKLSDTEIFKAFRELVTTDPNNPKKTSSDPIRRAKALGHWQRLMDTHNIAGMLKTAEKQAAGLRSPDSMISDADMAWEQKAREAADTDLREACRQYYWPHRSFTGAIADKIKWLEALDHNKRDAVLMAHGQPTQAQNKLNREQMKELGITK